VASARPIVICVSVIRWPVSRALVRDALLAVGVGVVVMVGSTRAAERQVPPREALDPAAYGLMALAAGALLARRVRPLAVLAITVVAASGYLAAGYPYGPIVFPMSIAMYTVGQELPLRRSLAACGVAVVAFIGPHLLGLGEPQQGDAQVGAVAAPSGFILAPWAIGTIMRLGRESAARTRAEVRERFVSEERLRIAREVHDVVGHGLAVINMQAGIALHVLDRRPEQARVALDAIKRTSKDALEELRGTLAVFRLADDGSGQAGNGVGRPDTGTEAPRRPMPGLDQVDTLVSAMAASGLPVDLVVSGERADIPASVDLAAYRIVQESLTNVLRHAGPATATVSVGYRPDEVVLEITDNGRAEAADASRTDGHGIAGMRERAAALGGTLQAGPRVEGGFRVRARLPREE
jgi:signal transduction histidine kinase